MRKGLVTALLLVCALAIGAAPVLNFSHAPPGQGALIQGPHAFWQAAGAPSFGIHTSSDLASGAGTVLRRPFSGDVNVQRPPVWDAGQLLAATDPSQRRVYTVDKEGETTFAFLWDELPTSVRQLLDADGLGAARVAYLRGARAREIGQPQGVFRARSSVLGDIVRSVPLIVGPPRGAGAAPGSREFIEQYANREKAVYVGANDGMLHAFSAESGAELFAFVPSSLHGNLAALSDPSYQPRPYVDGSASQRDIESGGRWRTVLVGGMGMGAPGLFSLDITDPARFAEGEGARWEFTAGDDPAIGHIHAPPVMARLRALDVAPAWRGRDVAIVSSGLNPAAGGSNGALFILALDKRAGEPWAHGSNYLRIDTGGAEGAVNALAPPAVVVGSSGEALHAYAGDLQGNLWHFDLMRMETRRVFTARDDGGQAQAITHAPLVVHGPGGGYLVVFGTGKLLEEADIAPRSFTVQSLYGIHDVPGRDSRPIRSRAELAERVISGNDRLDITGQVLDYFIPAAKRGWYVDLPGSRRHGERLAASPVTAGGVVVFHTIMPGWMNGSAPAGREYVLGALTGLPPDQLATAERPRTTGETVRVNPLAQLILIRGVGDKQPPGPTGAVMVTRRMALLPTEAGPGRELLVRHQAGRMGWREISNWQDLHDAARRGDGS